MKLYEVQLVGSFGESSSLGGTYPLVLANDTVEAYSKVRKHLDEIDEGFERDRELHSVLLLAEDISYPNCGRRLFM